VVTFGSPFERDTPGAGTFYQLTRYSWGFRLDVEPALPGKAGERERPRAFTEQTVTFRRATGQAGHEKEGSSDIRVGKSRRLATDDGPCNERPSGTSASRRPYLLSSQVLIQFCSRTWVDF
jgi:hypothetical protein